MYENKVNGGAKAGEKLGRDLDFFTMATTVNILASTTSGANAALSGSATTQAKLDKLVEVISLRGQPVILGTPATTDGVNYTVKFATEHTGNWTATTLRDDLVSHQTNGMGFSSGNTSFTLATSL